MCLQSTDEHCKSQRNDQRAKPKSGRAAWLLCSDRCCNLSCQSAGRHHRPRPRLPGQHPLNHQPIRNCAWHCSSQERRASLQNRSATPSIACTHRTVQVQVCGCSIEPAIVFLALPYPMPFCGYATIFLKRRVCLHAINRKLGVQISCPTKTRLNSKTRTNQDY